MHADAITVAQSCVTASEVREHLFGCLISICIVSFLFVSLDHASLLLRGLLKGRGQSELELAVCQLEAGCSLWCTRKLAQCRLHSTVES